MLWQPSLPEKYLKMTGAELAAGIAARKEELGSSLVILGHHYQVDEIIAHADHIGDSLKLSQIAARLATSAPKGRPVKWVVFCGVHFMAETADMLTPDSVSVILPDLSAGCSMADMAQYDDTVSAWNSIHESLKQQGWQGKVVPITYVNSTAAIKAFVGANGGACCTSSNADKVFAWAMKQASDVKVLFLPDQHLGRNTAAKFGIDVATQTCVYDPCRANKGDELGGATPEQMVASKAILWAGHCSVHKLFRPEHCDQIRAEDAAHPEHKRTNILVHPECAKEVVDKSDLAGSTEFIIKTIREAEIGSYWAVGTEIHLVNRLAREAKARGVHVRILSDCQCLCTTMFRIDQPHLLWVLDHLAGQLSKDGKPKVVNAVTVHPEVRRDALKAMERMLALTNPSPKFEAAASLD
ncbi:MAG: quinolinate synthase NadA [Phycisphaerales bacterium]